MSIRAVAIGASAGGIEALTAILPALPRSFRLPVFVVLHLPRDRPSLLTEIFAPKCALEVREALDKEPVSPGVIYFAPPDYHLLVDNGPILSLSVDEPVLYSRPSIDVLFESAAEIYGGGLAGVILTGGNEDGAAGLQAIGRSGGIRIAQDPGTAQASYMPRAAIDRDPPEYIVTLDRVASILERLSREEVTP